MRLAFVYRSRDSPVLDYIEVLYNGTRRHSHLGDINSEAFERPLREAVFRLRF